MKRGVVIFICVLSIVGVLTVLHFRCGMFTPYSYFTAQRDIASGRLRILQYGEPLVTDKCAILLAPKFGFHYEIVGRCNVYRAEVNGIDAYNATMTDFLNSKLGSNWKNKFDFQVDSLFRAANVDTIQKTVPTGSRL